MMESRSDTGAGSVEACEDGVDPEVTVVLPAWDAYVGPQLDRVLRSIRGQDDRCRVVLVDNASQKAIPSRPGIDVIRSPVRLTVGGARNLGLEHCETPFVIVWDADDLMLPGTLPLLRQRLAARPELVAYGLAIVDADSDRRHRWPRRWVLPLRRFPRLFGLLNCVWSVYPTTGATLMRTVAARAAGGYSDADSGDDWVLGASLLVRGPVGWEERPGRSYSRTPGSIWERHSTAGHLLGHAQAVRRRIRHDSSVPIWVRALLPAIGAGQWLAVRLVHVPRGQVRRLRLSGATISARRRATPGHQLSPAGRGEELPDPNASPSPRPVS